MLVLSRQRDETIMIGDDIEITIVDIRGDKVRLGITAPATVPVHRKEVYEAIQRENREASKVRMEDLPNLPKGSVRPGGSAGGQRPSMPTTRPAENKGVPQNPTQGTPGQSSGVPKNPQAPESPSGPSNGTA